MYAYSLIRSCEMLFPNSFVSFVHPVSSVLTRPHTHDERRQPQHPQHLLHLASTSTVVGSCVSKELPRKPALITSQISSVVRCTGNVFNVDRPTCPSGHGVAFQVSTFVHNKPYLF
jgi:hypothetical protein